MSTSTKKLIRIPVTLLVILGLAACKGAGTSGPSSKPTATPVASDTPSATEIPPAVVVNGEQVSQVDFDAQLARYEQAQSAAGNTVSPEAAKKTVMTDLVDTLLLEQAAYTYGFVLTDASFQSRLDDLASQAGGASALSAWETAHGYTDAEFRSELRRQIAAAWMRDRVTGSVPTTVEQAHVKQILLYNADEAQQVLGDLQSGTSFDNLAAKYDPVTKGDLGWFPHGYLSDPAIETAVFNLQPGQYTGIIQDEAGYHILFLIELDPAHPLSPEALLTLQASALQDWLTQRRNESTITYAP